MHKLNRVIFCSGLLIAAVLGFALTVFAQQVKDLNNTRFDYSVKYPANYQLKTYGLVVAFISPETDKKFSFSPSINIAVETLKAPLPTLEDFFARSKANLTFGGNKAQVLEEKKEKLGGADCYRIKYTSKQKQAVFKLEQVLAIHGGRAYVITYTALLDQFDRGLAQANGVIKSFKFTD